MGLEHILNDLAIQGCYPCVSLRGWDGTQPVWRAHVNGAGNYWSEGSTPYEALYNAEKAWTEAGKPLDGYATENILPIPIRPQPRPDAVLEPPASGKTAWIDSQLRSVAACCFEPPGPDWTPAFIPQMGWYWFHSTWPF